MSETLEAVTAQIDVVSDDVDQVDEEIADGADEGDMEVAYPRDGVRIDKNDRSLSEFRRWYDEGRLVIDPEWQRSYVWDVKRASKLIESFLVDIPVPVIYLAKNEDGNYDVIDGVQRLTSIFEFLSGKYPLTGLEMLSALNRMRFSDLPRDKQSKLLDTTLRTFELSPHTAKTLLFVIFQRLNSGGVALNEMEIRNCVYSGKLNNLIRTLAQFDEFRQSVNQNDVSKRMLDRSLVLRFLAFYERTPLKAQAGLKAFLNDFFENYRNPSPAKLDEFERRFKLAARASFTVFGSQAFRLRRQDHKGAGEWFSHVNASVFQVIMVAFTSYDLGQVTQRSDAIYEEFLDLITTDTAWVDCVTKSTGDASKIRYAFQTWSDRLAKVMSGASSTDTQRAFSRALKRELFEQDPTCSICSQAIRLINDAALDHEEHYWRGGKTIPSNARLVHRLCNMKRAK